MCSIPVYSMIADVTRRYSTVIKGDIYKQNTRLEAYIVSEFVDIALVVRFRLMHLAAED